MGLIRREIVKAFVMGAVLSVLPLVCGGDLSAKGKARPVKVRIETTEGDIKVLLYDDTPLHRDNFVKLVKRHFYDTLLFHRVIPEFMIQAGDPQSRHADRSKRLGSGDIGYNIPAEIVFPKYIHKRGALAAARQGDIVNPERKSSGCQFYIVEGRTYTDAQLDTMEMRITAALGLREPFKYSDDQRRTYKTFGGAPHLDGQYTVFGEVIEGYDVLQRICAKETDENDRPKEDVVIEQMKVVRR